jgi:hypothetical protein
MRKLAERLRSPTMYRLVLPNRANWSNNTTYHYESRDPDETEIRLLILLPGKFSDKIYVVLDKAAIDLEHPPVYEALSYA